MKWKWVKAVARVRTKKAHILPILILSSLALYSAGSYAWYSTGQSALNTTRYEGFPGGRLHDDFEGLDHIGNGRGRANKDIYVENYSSNKILARVRLTEYMEIGEGAGLYTLDNENNLIPRPENHAQPLSGADLANAQLDDRSTWAVVRPEGLLSDEATLSTIRERVTLHLGDDNSRPKIFMPTFNQNNQNAESNTTGVGLEVETWETNTNLNLDDPELVLEKLGSHDMWSDGQSHTSTLRTWDATSHQEVREEGVTHKAKPTVKSERNGYMTMKNWAEENYPLGNFWVHDKDGWAYWAGFLPSLEATSLLLNNLDINFANQETYYAMNVESDLATQEDWGNNWKGVSSSAEILLKKITE